ncbi:hypothetical protein JZ751_008381 [Albula glossodonta]|uniref:Gfo/Idh/MocA-like oxidoreductase N-terminal domain-containing protein n=1 Tax=Albula glossodonta TaxID=121402 RepID=A0A8T2N2C4_9TELE|nr:hypothetical protein JZ751_008381 [Albula glossodonta]
MPSPVHVIVVGAGNRGQTYAQFATLHPHRMQVVGVADPRAFARQKLQEQHHIPEENIYEDWRCIVEREKFADAAFICTPDRLHKDPAVALAKRGYHILLEKPMAVTAEDCTEIVEACIQSAVMLTVCHVLRYDPNIHKIKVGFYHFAHSFVRGNWRNEDESSFALLAKSCHDLDLIHHWAATQSYGTLLRLSSRGSLSILCMQDLPRQSSTGMCGLARVSGVLQFCP